MITQGTSRVRVKVGQEELVAALPEGAGPAVGERVQGAQYQGHKAQSGLGGEKKAAVRVRMDNG